MVKRHAIRSYTIMSYVYTILAVMVLVACWEGSRTSAAVVSQEIPQESIRLRILANSDAPQDQWIKRQIRDAIVDRMNGWVQGPTDIETARATVRAHLSELDSVVGQVLNRYGFDHPYAVELGMVPFPTKMYGERVYPAGDYEALLVTIGRGQGQNWWCVLFPPLCFVDLVAGEAVAKDDASKRDTVKRDGGQQDPGKKDPGQPGSRFASAKAGDGKEQAVTLQQSKPEIRSFVWDVLKKAGNWVKSRFFA